VALALKFVALTVLPLIVVAMMPADDASARGGRGGAGFSKPHVGGGHHSHGSRHSHRFRSGTRFGFFFGGAALVPWYYAPAPYPIYPPYPAGYVEQDGYWYYCPAAQAYYPYVTHCPGAEWQRVEPAPPPPG
jgi:hypothetical protein